MREKCRRYELLSDDIVGLLKALEGVKFPPGPTAIREPKDTIDYESMVSKLSMQGSPLREVFAKLDQWIHVRRIVKGDSVKEDKARTELAKVMSNFI